MKPASFVFITCVGMTFVMIAALFLTPQVPSETVTREDGSVQHLVKTHGYAHDRFSSMRQGGPSLERHGAATWLGLVFVLVQVLFYGGCLAMGATRNGRLGPMKVPLIAGTAVLGLIFVALFLSYLRYINSESPSLFLSLPRPTAWMLFAVWPMPVFFMIVYYRLFDSWFFTAEDERRLEELVAAERAAQQAEEPA